MTIPLRSFNEDKKKKMNWDAMKKIFDRELIEDSAVLTFKDIWKRWKTEKETRM